MLRDRERKEVEAIAAANRRNGATVKGVQRQIEAVDDFLQDVENMGRERYAYGNLVSILRSLTTGGTNLAENVC